MSTEETATPNQTEILNARLDTISANVRGLFTAAVAAIEGGDRADPAAMLAPALTLLEASIVALTEIADAQTRLANLAEAEFAYAMEAQRQAKIDAERMLKEKDNPKRSFIGQRA